MHLFGTDTEGGGELLFHSPTMKKRLINDVAFMEIIFIDLLVFAY